MSRKPGSNGGTCRSCGAPVLWITLIGRDGSRKSHPVNADGIESRVVLNGDRTEGAVRPVAVSHFATCPNREQHRQNEGGGHDRR